MADWRDAQDEEAGIKKRLPPDIEVPPGYIWGEYLKYMNWGQLELEAQPDDYVYQTWETYKLKAQYGLL